MSGGFRPPVEGYYCARAAEHDLHRDHHDHEHGFPPANDAGYLERLAWEIFQPGLSWRLILQKRPDFRSAFRQFELDAVASMGEGDVQHLLRDRKIIRHRRKIDAVIENAKIMQTLASQHGSVESWLMVQPWMDSASWRRLIQNRFRFAGPSVASEFLTGAGILPGAHHESCKIFRLTIEQNPIWLRRKTVRTR